MRDITKILSDKHAAASKGEWVVKKCAEGEEGEKCWCRIVDINSEDGMDFVAASGCLAKEDAEFLVAAHEYIPQLLDYIKELEEKLK